MSVPVDAKKSEIPVLISGAGPTGLFAAFLLGKMNIPYRIIERDLDFSILSKSMWFHSRTLEIFQMSDPELIQQAFEQRIPTPVHRFYYGGKVIRELDLMPKNNSHYKDLIHLQQFKLIRILADAIDKQGGKIDWGWELVDTKVVEATTEDNDEGSRETSWVETTIRRAVNETREGNGVDSILGIIDLEEDKTEMQYEYETVRSQFLIGADGARSVVRHKINMPFPGRTRDVYMMAFDGTVESDIPLDHVVNWMYNGSSVVTFPQGGDRIMIVGDTDPLSPEEFEAKKNETLTVEVFQKYLDETVHPQKFTIKTVNWLSYYRVNERRAKEFSYKGRIFLAGDSAHIHSPSGGQGLNLGLQDSYNLAWRIALVLKGTAPPSVLDTYSEERSVIADQVIKLSSELLDEDFNYGGVFQRVVKRIVLALAPIVHPLMSIKAAPMAMMNQRYSENSLNKRHRTQWTPSGQGAVGRRAEDGHLVALNSGAPAGPSPNSPSTSQIDNRAASMEKTEMETVRLHELIAYTGVFQVVVFTGNQWKDDPDAAAGLSSTVEKYLGLWRSKWCMADDNDGEKLTALERLFMVHTITTLSATSTPNPLTGKDVGEGKAYTDLKGKLHRRYSVETSVKKGRALGGAIVVIRPDSHIAYRVQGVGENAWSDVNEYFQSILV
ncbi:hypothetical protein EMPS_09580 [Entomortierella parvispora]|uniref:FAD-binding domain-containing protein n=1 Tax=Entomortierella parvispora TaxID=205924 RepID=A0A9P3HIG7_9FUNG|nr:hypothetical protein EMPS_09580 [Entomortierella parvispora]